MISRLKRKFIITATVSMFLLMTVLVLIMNLVNYYEVISESDQIMEILSQPGVPPINDKTPAGPKDMQPFMPVGMSPEVLYESRFFIVMVSPDGEILQSDLSRIISVDEASAKDYISRALDSRNARGFIGQFRYAKAEDARGTRILFLDCGRRLDSFRSFLLISIGVGLFGCVLVFLFLFWQREESWRRSPTATRNRNASYPMPGMRSRPLLQSSMPMWICSNRKGRRKNWRISGSRQNGSPS